MAARTGKARETHPEPYLSSDKIAKGVQRWKCKASLCTYCVGSGITQQKRSHVNRDIRWVCTNGTPIAKMCDFTRLSPPRCYAKIAFNYAQIADFTAPRERIFDTIDWEVISTTLTTASQTLNRNWSNKAHACPNRYAAPLHRARQHWRLHGGALGARSGNETA